MGNIAYDREISPGLSAKGLGRIGARAIHPDTIDITRPKNFAAAGIKCNEEIRFDLTAFARGNGHCIKCHDPVAGNVQRKRQGARGHQAHSQTGKPARTGTHHNPGELAWLNPCIR